MFIWFCSSWGSIFVYWWLHALGYGSQLAFVFLLDRLPDVVFTAGAILTLLCSYAYVWFWAVRFAYNQKMRLFEVQLGSFVLLALMISLFLLDGSSMKDIMMNWDDAGCAFVPPAFTFCVFLMHWCCCRSINLSCGVLSFRMASA